MHLLVKENPPPEVLIPEGGPKRETTDRTIIPNPKENVKMKAHKPSGSPITDEMILEYDNVPVEAAARYLGWSVNNVRLSLREGTAPFGIAVKGKNLTYLISPGGLVEYKRKGVPCMTYKEMRAFFKNIFLECIQEKGDTQ